MASTRAVKKNAVMARTMALSKRGNVAPPALTPNQSWWLRKRVRTDAAEFNAMLQRAVAEYQS